MADVRRPWTWLAAILILAAGLRLYDLDRLSLWNDELFSRYYPRMGQAFLWGAGRRMEPTPPLYYSLLAGWMGVFGESAAAIRLFSVVASMPGVVVAYALGRDLFGSARAGLLGALCLALSATNVFYAQEARSYALEGTAVAVALLGMAWFLGRQHGWAGLLLWAGGAVLAVYCHVTAALFVVAANLVVLASFAGPRRLLTVRGFWRWSGANLLVALACVPLLAVVLSPAVGTAIGWMEPLDLAGVTYAFATVIAGPAVFDMAEPVALSCVAMLGLLLRPWRPGRRAIAVVVATPVLFFVLMAVASWWQPVLMLRTVAWLAVPFSLVLGGALARRPIGWPVAVVALLCGAIGFQAARAPALKEDWRGFLQALVPRLAAPAMVVLAPSMPATAMVAYAGGVRPLFQLPGTGPETVESGVIPRLLGVETLSWDGLGRAIEAGRPVWVLVRGNEDDWLRAHLARLPEARERVARPPGVALRW